MTIQQINDSSAALYITPADLKSRGISSHSDLTLEGALSLATDAFRDAGITLTGSIEIEAFPDACGVLIFAHILSLIHIFSITSEDVVFSPPPPMVKRASPAGFAVKRICPPSPTRSVSPLFK